MEKENALEDKHGKCTMRTFPQTCSEPEHISIQSAKGGRGILYLTQYKQTTRPSRALYTVLLLAYSILVIILICIKQFNLSHATLGYPYLLPFSFKISTTQNILGFCYVLFFTQHQHCYQPIFLMRLQISAPLNYLRVERGSQPVANWETKCWLSQIRHWPIGQLVYPPDD